MSIHLLSLLFSLRCNNIDEYGAPKAPVLAQDSNDAMVCETVIVEDCTPEKFDCLPGSTDPRLVKLLLFMYICYNYFFLSDVILMNTVLHRLP